MLGAGDIVEHYRIEALLGEGGMGRVYRAFDTRLERQVALKLLLGDGDAEAAARLVREARAAAALDHPNAVHVYAVGSLDGAPYIAMELVRGQTLRDRLAAPDPPRLDARLGWLVDVGRALAAAHALGIVHRDVKPDNVMIGDDGRVKVLDFGIARRLAGPIDPSAPTDVSAPTLTARGAVVGTPAYMAPEQIRGLEVDARADQFAWAVTAFEVLAGARPWGGDALSLIAGVVSDPTPPLAPRVPGLPAGVADIVTRALEKRPEDRFASMKELLAALEPFAGRGPSLPPLSREAQAAPRTSRGDLARVALGAAAVAASAIVHARARAKPARPPWWRRFVLPAAGLGLAALLLYTGRDRRAPATVPAPETTSPSGLSAIAAVAASGSGRGLGPSLPPRTPPAAARAFAEAMSLWRTRSQALAMDQLERAIEVDPTLTAAQLRYALFSFVESPSEARSHLLKVQDMRATLDPRETALLDGALAYMAEPPDVAGFASRLAPIVQRDPDDIEALYWLGLAQRIQGETGKARRTLARALAADPSFGPAASLQAEIQIEEEGDFEGGLATIDACLAKNPGSALCIGNQVTALTLLGRCEEAERTARRWSATMPEHPGGFYNLAAILDGLGRPVESVEESLKAMSERLRPSKRGYAEAWNRAKLAMVHGAFDDAERALRDAEQIAPSRAEVGVRAEIVTTLARVYLEEGRPREAGELADALLKRESALTRTALPTWHGIAFDPMILVASISSHFGALPRAELDRRRAAWLAEQERAVAHHPERGVRTALWAYAWVATAETPEEAKEAVAKLTEDLPPALDAYPENLADVARVRLLAGDAAGAVPLLRRAVRSCQPLEHPLGLVRAQALLGEALEATGDKPGARAAYDALLARWGNARPRSVTADRVKVRLRAMGK